MNQKVKISEDIVFSPKDKKDWIKVVKENLNKEGIIVYQSDGYYNIRFDGCDYTVRINKKYVRKLV